MVILRGGGSALTQGVVISIFYCWKVKAIIIIIILSLRYVFQSGLNGAFTACKWLKSVGPQLKNVACIYKCEFLYGERLAS